MSVNKCDVVEDLWFNLKIYDQKRLPALKNYGVKVKTRKDNSYFRTKRFYFYSANCEVKFSTVCRRYFRINTIKEFYRSKVNRLITSFIAKR